MFDYCISFFKSQRIVSAIQQISESPNSRKLQAPVDQRADNSIHRINHYPVDSVLCFRIIYTLDSDLAGG